MSATRHIQHPKYAVAVIKCVLFGTLRRNKQILLFFIVLLTIAEMLCTYRRIHVRLIPAPKITEKNDKRDENGMCMCVR